MPIHYTTGDATVPHQKDQITLIVHVCNDIGAWGSGFVVPLGKRYPRARQLYREAFADGESNLELGDVQMVSVGDNIHVANLIGQHKIGMAPDGTPPVRYEAIRKGLRYINLLVESIQDRVVIQMPRMGCGLAGGSWAKVQQILEEELEACNPESTDKVVVYDFPGGTYNP